MSTPTPPSPRDPAWYKQGVIYQAHVRSFLDSDGNGIGDFRGLTQKLDYLQDLGVSILWLLPFYPSPLKDDGYDIADYYSINPIYGTLDDFKEFLDAAHQRSLRVITELVVNHTSDQHPWFQRSRRAKPGDPWRDFYVWSETPERYREARIIFRDFEPSNWTWDHVAQAYFWHRFYSHQPDLNFDHLPVHDEIIRVLDFWLDLGVDGLRLDAVPYLYEREGTNCENLPETHGFLKKLRHHVDAKYGDRMLLAEANQWPEDAVAYFGSGRGDECHMAFHFPLMPRLFMSVRMEDRTPIIDILEQTPPIPETCQWAIFLRNHDELTLEMVTEEERDYMYRVYAADVRARINLGIRRRLAPLLNNDRRRIELLNALLLSMPGTPVIYYGDEIGMGDNIYLGDRNGVRTPMHWSSDKNAGFSRANPQSLYLPIILDPDYHYEAVNVEAQQRNSSSLLWWMKLILATRQRSRALAEGSITFLQPENRKVFAFLREYEQERVLVIANLSRYAQPVELDLSAFRGLVPVEIFGRTRFAPISEEPYQLTLNRHAFFWFTLEAPTGLPTERGEGGRALHDLPVLSVTATWEELFIDLTRSPLARLLPAYIRQQRWFGGKARDIDGIQLLDAIPVASSSGTARLTLLQVSYAQGDPEVYLLPLCLGRDSEAQTLLEQNPGAGIARIRSGSGEDQLLYDAVSSPGFAQELLDAINAQRSFRGVHGELVARATEALSALQAGASDLEPAVKRAEQSNSVVTYGDRLILKLFRRPEAGINPDVEIGRHLTAHGFSNTPALGGTLEYRTRDEMRSVAVLTQFIPNAEDAFQHTSHALGRYFERALRFQAEHREPPAAPAELLEAAHEPVPATVTETIGTYLESARLLAVRTAELHRALAESEHPDFAPEPFSPHYQRSLYQSMRNQLMENFTLLRQRLPRLPETVRESAEAVLAQREEILHRYRELFEHRLDAMRIRCHGDYHLGQVLYTGKDFIILDFEGEPARSLGARRLKRSPLSDVAGMLRSFQYATAIALEDQVQHGRLTPESAPRTQPWATYWHRWVSVRFLQAYLKAMEGSRLLPQSTEQLRILLKAYLLDKAVYEVAYELNNRPERLPVPFAGILDVLSR